MKKAKKRYILYLCLYYLCLRSLVLLVQTEQFKGALSGLRQFLAT